MKKSFETSADTMLSVASIIVPHGVLAATFYAAVHFPGASVGEVLGLAAVASVCGLIGIGGTCKGIKDTVNEVNTVLGRQQKVTTRGGWRPRNGR